MFTGIIEAVGTLRVREPRGGDLRLRFDTPEGLMRDCSVGDSISVSGCCLTMLDTDPSAFSADLSHETLARTSLGDREPGDKVNLELAMRASDRLGGHLVSGHVDGLAELLTKTPDARAEHLWFETPPELARYIAPKGSVCLDGISLTVNEVEDNRFSVCIIPHTQEVTTFGSLRLGQKVNLEVDLIARYLERLNQYDGVPAAVG